MPISCGDAILFFARHNGFSVEAWSRLTPILSGSQGKGNAVLCAERAKAEGSVVAENARTLDPYITRSTALLLQRKGPFCSVCLKIERQALPPCPRPLRLWKQPNLMYLQAIEHPSWSRKDHLRSNQKRSERAKQLAQDSSDVNACVVHFYSLSPREKGKIFKKKS